MKNLRYICAQPRLVYYAWQVEVVINNFIKKGINPAIHINHGRHFTSHFNVYTKNFFEIDNYWGNHKDIWPF